jgi:HD-like signal output (HDOD) protein
MDERGRIFLQEIIKNHSMPSLSPLALKLMSLASHDDSDPREMVRIIESDPGFTTRLLSLANSPLYRRSDLAVTSINRALLMLGLREVRIMALSLSLRDTIPTKSSRELNYSLFWRLGVTRAIMAQGFAREIRLLESEEAFTAGLILEIGLPILLRALPPEISCSYPGLETPRPERIAWEEEQIGINHRELGAAVVEHMQLPTIFADCMLFDAHKPQSFLPQVINFACFAAESCFLPCWTFTQMHSTGLSQLNLNSEQINRIIAETLEMGGQVASALEVDMDQEHDMLLVMEKAGEALNRLRGEIVPKVRQAMRENEQNEKSVPAQNAINLGIETVMHDIRKSLISVSGLASRLSRIRQGGDAARQYAETIIDDAARLDNILKQLKTLFTPVAPCSITLELTEFFKQTEESNKAAGLSGISWRVPPNPLRAIADPALLQEALRLLIDYLQAGADPKDKALRISVARRGDRVKICAAGRGPLADKNDDEPGPEFNLIRVRHIIEKLGGELQMDSVKGRIYIYLQTA